MQGGGTAHPPPPKKNRKNEKNNKINKINKIATMQFTSQGEGRQITV